MAAATQKIVILADDKTGAAISSAIRNSKKLDNQLRKTGDSMRNTTRQSRAHMAQLGHQVQDVAVQLQMGMNPLMVFAQQGSQIASIFGVGGAMLGGLIAVAAVIGSQLAPALFEANKGIKELKDELMEAVGSFDKLNQAEKKIVMAGLAKELDERRASMTTLNAELKQQERVIREANEAIATGKANILGEIKARKDASDAITEINVKRMIESRRIQDVIDKMKELNTASAITGRGAEPTIFGGETRKQLEAYRDQVVQNAVPAAIKFEMAQARLRMATDEFGLSAGEVAKELERLKELYGLTADEVETLEEANDKLKISMDDVKRDGIMSLEDSLVSLIDGTKSVKEAFSDMARSIISDLIKMQIRQSVTIPLANAMGVQMRANGGPVSPNKPYIVGEKGPELMIPRGGGTVVPNSQMGGGEAPVTVNVNVTTGVQQTVRTEIANMLPDIANATKAAVIDARRRGGSMAKAFGA